MIVPVKETAEASGDVKTIPNSSRIRRVWTNGLPVWILLIVALTFLACGFGLGIIVRSPAEVAADAKPPASGLITAEIETRQITSTVLARANVSFSDPVSITPHIPVGVESAIITGHVPKVGNSVQAGDVLIEVSGRPVIVLPGKFPTYRSLGPGSVGPDVLQLRAALRKLGYAVGKKSKDIYDKPIADAMAKLYKDAGYPAPGSNDAAKRQAVRNAEDYLASALTAEKQASSEYKLAKKALLSGVSTMSEVSVRKQAVTESHRQVIRAKETLAEAKKATWATMPSGEVMFVKGLPRRVDEVNVSLGQDIGGVEKGSVVLSGSNIHIVAQISADEASLLREGGRATVTTASNEEIDGVIALISEIESQVATHEVSINLNNPNSVDRESLVGNVRVSLMVGSSSNDALVVPVAAVSSDSSGQAQIELVDGQLIKDQAVSESQTHMVNIETGLAAEGYVEIKPVSETLAAGDLVVIGITPTTVTGAGVPTNETP